MEVDNITTRAWQNIYDGNAEDQQLLVDNFIAKHDEHLFHAKEIFDVPTIDANMLQHECMNARKSVGGLDQWTPEDFTLLSTRAFHYLAMLLNIIEEGAPWPTDTLTARASFLSKDPDDVTNPLAYWVLLMLPVLYRRWASLRLHSLAPWVDRWTLEEMCAGVASKSAEDGWWATSLLLERLTTAATPFTGGAVDIMKCFDQLERKLIYAVAKKAGMPTRVLTAYTNYQENLTLRNTIHGGLGAPFTRRTGIPQGCPLSMMITALLMRPWILKMRQLNTNARVLADDMLLITHGPKHLTHFNTALSHTPISHRHGSANIKQQERKFYQLHNIQQMAQRPQMAHH